ncbi:MAG: hypothetical protein Q9211_006847, partial [Gyalolechia sp. 1 TL-2023]
TDSDSNILKIYRMLDRSNGVDAHYYQPGIGTYVDTHNLSHTSVTTRLISWYKKAKDSAVGTSFDSHVMGAYKFLMRCYQDDDIYVFGFSRGAYIARFLAEMLDQVGLLSNGNEEIRAKFRSDLVSDSKASNEIKRHRQYHHGHHHHQHGLHEETNGNSSATQDKEPTLKSVRPDRFRRPSQVRPNPHAVKQFNERLSVQADTQPGNRLTRKDMQRMRSHSPGGDRSRGDSGSPDTAGSFLSFVPLTPNEEEYELDEAADQDIEELWFPGCHADLGGGWPLANGEESALSHAPLVWMIREAQRAGLEFDRDQMLNLHCCDEDPRMLDAVFPSTASPIKQQPLPTFNITTPSNPDIFQSPHSEQEHPGWHAGLEPEAPKASEFHQRLHNAATKGVLHDCLQFNNGLPHGSVLSWKMMEFLPFRRMDLRPDGSWKAISFPLPMGEVRDIPEDAKIHHSAIRRMEADETYRPGNLIIGGGGRGKRKAPKERGIGEWVVHKNKGDPVGEVLVRKGKSLDEEIKEESK